MPGEQTGQECRRIHASAAELERLLAQWAGTRSILGNGVLQLACESRAHPRLPDVVDALNGGQRPLEIVDDLVAAGGERGAEMGDGERHPRDADRVTRAFGDVGGQTEQPTRVDDAAGASQGIGLGRKDVDQPRVVEIDRCLGQGRTKPAQVAGGLGECECSAVVVRGGEGPPHGAVRSVNRDRRGEVTRELRRSDVAAAISSLLEGSADRSVQVDRLRRLNPGQHRLAQQVVGEPGTGFGPGQHSGLDGGPGSGVDLDHGTVDCGRDDVGEQHRAHDRRGLEDLDRVGWQPVDPAGDGVVHGDRDLLLGRAGVVAEQGELANEERMSTGAAVDLLGHGGVDVVARQRGDESAHGSGVEALDPEMLGERGEIPDALSGRRRQLVVTVGADQADAGGRRCAGHELQEGERGVVSPLQVVEDDHDRLVLSPRSSAAGSSRPSPAVGPAPTSRRRARGSATGRSRRAALRPHRPRHERSRVPVRGRGGPRPASTASSRVRRRPSRQVPHATCTPRSAAFAAAALRSGGLADAGLARDEHHG